MSNFCNTININNPCSSYMDTKCIFYSGSNLTNINTRTNDNLSIILNNINDVIGKITGGSLGFTFTYPLVNNNSTVEWQGNTTNVPEGANGPYYFTEQRVKDYADTLYVSLNTQYDNPSFINTIDSSKVVGLSLVATSGNYNDLINKPFIPSKTSDLTNDGQDGVHPFITLQDIPPQVFQDDVIVSLSNNKTVGKYTSGQTIPAKGLTFEEFANLIAREAINPTVTLTSPTVIQFNQTNISNVLNFSYVINSLGATVSSAVLQWRRNNTGAWTVLSTSTSITTFTHTLTDSNFNTQPFNYQYIVTDSAGGTTTVNLTLTPQAYVAPSIVFSAPASYLQPAENNTNRERGNTMSVLQGSITRNSAYVNIQSYKFQLSVNGGAFVDVSGDIAIGQSGGTISNYPDHTADSGAYSMVYKVIVTDDFTTTSATYTIALRYFIFFGDSVAAPTTSTSVRALPSREFTNGTNPFILNTGSTNRIFTIAMPSTNGLSSVIDLDALNANITGNYIESDFNVQDYAGTNVPYKVFTMTNAIPYSSSHRHQVTFI